MWLQLEIIFTKTCNMKYLIFILAFQVSINFIYGQTTTEINKDSGTNKIYTKVEVEASYPGGEEAWKKFISRTIDLDAPIRYGAEAGAYLVTVKFIVNIDGKLIDIACENDPGYGTCQEAIRVLKSSKKWLPASINGKKVRAYRRQTLTFHVGN